MACRNADKAGAARERLVAEGIPGASLEVRLLDLGDLASVAAFATGYRSAYDRLDLLINNAGLMAIGLAHSADGHEMQWAVNHLGHMALTLDLLPALLATPGSRAVTVTSVLHRPGRIRIHDPGHRTGGYGRWSAYSQSKLANLLFAKELGRRLRAAGHGTLSIAAHPGFARTELGKDEPRMATGALAWLEQAAAQSAEAGSLPLLRAATDPHASSGELYGPRWHSAGPPVKARASRRARDPRLAAATWRVSLGMLGRAEPTELPDLSVAAPVEP